MAFDAGPVEFGDLFAGEQLKINEEFGRCGWERVLPDYKPARVLLEKELN